MKTVKAYEEFVSALNEAGFMLFGGKTSLLTLGDITDPTAWHTGGPLDPWGWKCALITRRDGAYAKVRGGVNFMIANGWYPVFLAALTPDEPIETRYERGEVDAAVWKLHSLFDQRPTWSRHELSAASGLKKSALERALNVLQQEMEITASDEVQRVTVDLKPVGWPSMEYTRVDVWAADALDEAAQWDRAQAREKILTQALRNSPRPDEGAARRFLFP